MFEGIKSSENWPEDVTILRIMSSVEYLSPITPNIVMLRSDLRSSYLKYRIYEYHGNEGVSRSRHERLKQIESYSKKLIKALLISRHTKEYISLASAFPKSEGEPVSHVRWNDDVEDPVHRIVDSGSVDPSPSFEALFEGLLRLQSQSSYLIADQSAANVILGQKVINNGAPTLRTSRQAIDLLVTEWLSDIYLRHVGRKPGISRSINKSSSTESWGPFVRFVKLTLEEMNIRNKDQPYSEETIARLVSAQHSGTSRTRNRGR